MVDSDGGSYEIWAKQRTDAPSIIGTATFQQYWSIRTKMHCGGTITTGNHFRAWEAAGLELGDQTYLALAVEGENGGGTANLTVGVLPTTFPPETTTSTQRTLPYHYSTHSLFTTSFPESAAASSFPTSTSTSSTPMSTSTTPTSTSTTSKSTSTTPTTSKPPHHTTAACTPPHHTTVTDRH